VRPTSVPRAFILALTLALGAYAPSAVLAAPTAKMSAALTPERLGRPTTISASFQITSPEPRPPVLTGVKLAYPHNLGFATSGLGLAACDPVLLEENGPEVCPANSRMGRGSALVEIPLSGFLHAERVALTLLAGPSPSGYLHVLVSGFGSFPVSALVVLSAELLPAGLGITIPPIPTLPEGPYVSLVEMHLELGGRLTYYERVRGKTVAYHPPGIGLPRSCPRGGFRFAATFAFLGGESAVAQARVACPRRR
jgi:hypothetical protein